LRDESGDFCFLCTPEQKLEEAKKSKIRAEVQPVGVLSGFEIDDAFYRQECEGCGASKSILVKTGPDQFREIYQRRADLTASRRRLFQLIEDTPDLVWMLLTKRPQEFRNFLPKAWLKDPRQNVWLLTTMEHQDYVWRIEELLKAPAVVHGISVEPMLGPIALPPEFLELGNRAWVITGGESGPGARPTQVEWFRSLRDSCISAAVPFLFKQWGEHGSDVVRIRKKQAGRVLNEREWDEFPLAGKE
jgi:protein gp37